MLKQTTKHNLAIIALSVLLVVCIALTATFAAFKNTDKATGTIYFIDGNYTVEAKMGDSAMSGERLSYVFTGSISLSTNEITFENNKVPTFIFKTLQDGQALYWGVKMTQLTQTNGGVNLTCNGDCWNSEKKIFTGYINAGNNTSYTNGVTFTPFSYITASVTNAKLTMGTGTGDEENVTAIGEIVPLQIQFDIIVASTETEINFNSQGN